MNQSKEELLNEAVQIAKDVLAGKLQPNEGCSKLGEINRCLNWPKELSALGALAHEQYDHENLGITADSCIPEILKECKILAEHGVTG